MRQSLPERRSARESGDLERIANPELVLEFNYSSYVAEMTPLANASKRASFIP